MQIELCKLKVVGISKPINRMGAPDTTMNLLMASACSLRDLGTQRSNSGYSGPKSITELYYVLCDT